jgi:hypothetical protein
VLFTIHYLGNQIKEGEMDGAYRMQGGVKKYAETGVFVNCTEIPYFRVYKPHLDF